MVSRELMIEAAFHGYVSPEECERRVKEARNIALEEAAIIADRKASLWMEFSEVGDIPQGAKYLAELIRSLKDSSHD